MAVAQLIRSVDAFGFRLTQMGMPAGASYSYVIPYRMPRADFSALQLWTKGLVAVRNASVDMPNRQRGVLTTELNDTLEAGLLTLTAIEYAEWWCLDASKNGGVLPAVRKLELGTGSHEITEATRLLVCDGDVVVGGVAYGAGSAVQIPSGSQVSVGTDMIGLKF